MHFSSFFVLLLISTPLVSSLATPEQPKLSSAEKTKVTVMLESMKKDVFATKFLQASQLVPSDVGPQDVDERFGVQVGTSHSCTKTFTLADTQIYGDLTHEHSDIHYDKEKAVATGFFSGIVTHGMLSASLFSHLIGTNYPEVVYLNQTLKFLQPVYLNEAVEARTTIKTIQPSKKGLKCTLLTTLTKVKDASVAIEGEAIVLLPGNK